MHTVVYGISLPNCKRQKGCLPFWCLIWLLFFLRGNQNSLKNTSFSYYYFLIWAMLTIFKTMSFCLFVCLQFFIIFIFLALTKEIQNSPAIQAKISPHLTLVCLKPLVLSFLKMEWNGNNVILKNVQHELYIWLFFSSLVLVSQLNCMKVGCEWIWQAVLNSDKCLADESCSHTQSYSDCLIWGLERIFFSDLTGRDHFRSSLVVCNRLASHWAKIRLSRGINHW